MGNAGVTKRSLCFVKVTVEDPGGHKVQFEADHFEIELIHHTDSTVVLPPEFHRIKPSSVVVSTPSAPVDIPAPKYVPAMGDAAHEYCNEFRMLSEALRETMKFRWHEVWKRMWAAREK